MADGSDVLHKHVRRPLQELTEFGLRGEPGGQGGQFVDVLVRDGEIEQSRGEVVDWQHARHPSHRAPATPPQYERGS